MTKDMDRTQIRIHLINDLKSFKDMQKDWNVLLQNSPHQSIFLTWEWLFSWWTCYGSQKELQLITAWDGDNLVGIAPFMLYTRKKYGLKFRLLCSLGIPECDVSGFILCNDDQRVLGAIWSFIDQDKDKWDILEFYQFLEETSHLNVFANRFRQSGYKVSQKKDRHLYIPIEGAWQDFFQSRSKNLRHDLNRRLKRARENGKISYKHYSGQEISYQHINTIFEINQHSQYPHVYQIGEERAFLQELRNSMSSNGWLDIHLLYFNETPVAYRVGFIYKNRYEDWRSGFDTNYYDLAFGKILLMQIIEENFLGINREIDFLRGGEDYKERWQPMERFYVNMQIISPINFLAISAFLYLPKLKHFFLKWIQSRKA
jgi:CelD/BcsL family acetyltransferase involved in cellulose biosynthesis